MSSDTWTVIAIAMAWSGLVGVVGLVIAYRARRRSLKWAFAAVALISVLGLVAGVLGTARAMFLSQHDFEVVLLVSLVAGPVSLLFAWWIATWAVRGSRAVQEATRQLGVGGSFVAPPDTAAELSD
nr:two-component sensor histidine kinase [Nocardioidaceae bacterium]